MNKRKHEFLNFDAEGRPILSFTTFVQNSKPTKRARYASPEPTPTTTHKHTRPQGRANGFKSESPAEAYVLRSSVTFDGETISQDSTVARAGSQVDLQRIMQEGHRVAQKHAFEMGWTSNLLSRQANITALSEHACERKLATLDLTTEAMYSTLEDLLLRYHALERPTGFVVQLTASYSRHNPQAKKEEHDRRAESLAHNFKDMFACRDSTCMNFSGYCLRMSTEHLPLSDDEIWRWAQSTAESNISVASSLMSLAGDLLKTKTSATHPRVRAQESIESAMTHRPFLRRMLPHAQPAQQSYDGPPLRYLGQLLDMLHVSNRGQQQRTCSSPSPLKPSPSGVARSPRKSRRRQSHTNFPFFQSSAQA